MKKNLEILEVEPKLTKDEKKYWRFKTSEGWMSCFDKIASEKLKEFKGKIASCEVVQSGDFSNIKKCYGIADMAEVAEEELKQMDEKPEVVKPGQTYTDPKFEVREISRVGKSTATMYASYAKDVFCAMCDAKYEGTAAEIMEKSINLVKQAKEAFED